MSEKLFVIRNMASGHYVGADSGGYPYDADLHRAKFFYGLDKARGYCSLFKSAKWEIHELHISSTVVDKDPVKRRTEQALEEAEKRVNQLKSELGHYKK